MVAKTKKKPKFSRTKVTIQFDLDPVLNLIFNDTVSVTIDNADDSAAVVGSATYEVGKADSNCRFDFNSLAGKATIFKLVVETQGNETTVFNSSSELPSHKIEALLEKAAKNPDFARALVELAKKNRVDLDVEEGEAEEDDAGEGDYD